MFFQNIYIGPNCLVTNISAYKMIIALGLDFELLGAMVYTWLAILKALSLFLKAMLCALMRN